MASQYQGGFPAFPSLEGITGFVNVTKGVSPRVELGGLLEGYLLQVGEGVAYR